MELTKRDRWEIFMQDLEERLAYHLWQKSIADKLIKKELASAGKALVEVRESEEIKGTWEVWEGGRKRFVYDGSLGHYRATKKAAEILEQLQSEYAPKRLRS